jgi:hypothetical protein
VKKVLSYILISFVVFANLFAPIGVALEKNNVKIVKNEASADTLGIKMSSTPIVNSNQIIVKVDVTWSNFQDTSGTSEGVRVTVKDPSGAEPEKIQIIDLTTTQGNNQSGSYTFDKLTPGKEYEILSEARQIDMFTWNASWKTLYNTMLPNAWGIWSMTPEEIKLAMDQGSLGIVTINDKQTTLKTGETTVITGKTQTSQNNEFGDKMPACGITPGSSGTFTGCIAQGFYYVLFMPTSYLFALAGTFFDYTFSYSVQDSSYRSSFVVQGWGLVRDFCNIFFIFVMLYIAISTILSLHGFKTKETIINVVIIGLFINFSLFATQVIIDASNITARVFYNSDAIKITEKGANGVTEATPMLKIEEGGVIPLSAAIVNKVNPQNMIIQSGKINQIPDKGGATASDSDSPANMNAGTFILIVAMASAINIVGLTVFFTIGFLFVARVIGLWLAMIMAPLAFFTYILPQLEGTKTIGWKNWWPETLKLAFLAPVFIFFMYLILKFLSMDLISEAMSKSMSTDGLSYFAITILPFVFIMILMIKAKNIAVGMSGEFGEMATKLGSSVGGMVLGGAAGAGAMVLRGTLGQAGSKLANSKFASTTGLFGRKLGDLGKWTGEKTFDARNTKLGGLATKGLGVDMGKAKEGGFTKFRADRVSARQKRAKELEVHEDEELKQNKNKLDLQLKDLQDKNHLAIDTIDGKLKAARQRKLDAKNGSKEEQDAIDEIRDLNAEKSKITNGIAKNSDGTYKTSNGKISEAVITEAIKIAAETERASTISGVAASESISKYNSVKGIPGVNGGPGVMGSAEAARKDAVDEAAKIETAAINKAAADKVAAISEAKKVEMAAITAAATADMAATSNPSPENISAASIMRTAATVATTNRINTESSATTAEIDAIAKAGREKAKAEAEAIRNETNAITSAEIEKNAAIDKASADNIAATTAGAAAAEAVAEGEAARVSGGIGRSMNELQYTDIPKADSEISHENAHRKTKYAKSVNSGVSRVYNFITTAGQDSGNVAREAEYKIRMEAKIESSGGHSAPSASHAAPAAHTTPAATTHASPAGGAAHTSGH